MDATHPPRVLLRPHTAAPPPPQNGVVVVGIVGGRYDDVSHLVNKIIDSHEFGSGNGGTSFQLEPATKEWSETRKLSYYHHKEQGIVYVQFYRVGYWRDGSGLEDQEFGDLQAWLFMFSVCHLIILIQEGSRFDTQMLKKFRALQAAKHSMGPFVRSLNMPSSGQQASAYASMADSFTSSKNPSSVRGRLILNRNATQGQMAGLGSHTSMSPGQCSPVALFVFRDDFTEIFPDEEPSEASSSSNANTFGRPNRPMKGVVLARRTSKGEAGARKKLQSSLEAQIRFSIKKCRTLSGFDSVHGGSRTGPAAISSPLFSLDSSRAVLLIDHSSSKSGESLEYAIGLVEEVLDGKATPDSLLLESHQRYREDLLALKEFIFRQSETLSGKGVAAASTSSRKSMTAAPQLPTIGVWLSSCQAILNKILSTKYVASEDENDRSADPLEYAVSHIDHISRSNTIFSSLWCQKAYPIAKQVYLDGLPRYYTSALHDDHLNKALRVLKAMVKGPCVQSYLTKLKDECVMIWSSGRQLCDAVSLTGNPCIHPRHETDSDKGAEFEPHSSGLFYLHACACGRSRRLRPDPFEQETANSMNVFVDCDKNLPAVQLPPNESVGGFFLSSSSSWHILRVGSAKYYDPSKGLHQSGFYATHRFLLKWMLHFEKTKEINHGSSDGASTGVDNQGGEAGMQRKPSFAIERSSSKANFASVVGFSNFTMRKPFSEVVAGAASSKNPLSIDVKGVGKSHRTGEIDHDVESKSIMKIDLNADGVAEDYSSEISTRANSYEQMKDCDHVQPITAYVGFEHECPHGHRFILSSEHLNELGSPYAVVTEDNDDLPPRDRRRRQETDKTAKVTNHGRNRRQSRGGGRARNSHNSKEKSANNGISVSNKPTQLNRRGKDQIEMGDIDLEKGTTADHGGSSSSLLDRGLPIYMNCPHCKASTVKNETSNTKFASTVSQLQRIFVVTPPFPILVAADPIVQFEVSCLPHSVPNRESKLRFSLGCPVILPPESFLSVRLPFVYTVELEDGTIHSLRPFENEPHLTACIVKGTTLNASNGKNLDTAELAT